MNWALAGLIGILGFASCEKIGAKEYASPHADYTVKGKVVNKATKKPIEGIRVSYIWAAAKYGVIPTSYQPKASVTTNAKGEFKITESFSPNQTILPVSVEDIDGEKNGSFQSETLEVDFKNATHSGKRKSWYHGEYTVTQNIEMTEKTTIPTLEYGAPYTTYSDKSAVVNKDIG
jgi:putative lipoprotein (rSAM/lipoprotein system)